MGSHALILARCLDQWLENEEAESLPLGFSQVSLVHASPTGSPGARPRLCAMALGDVGRDEGKKSGEEKREEGVGEPAPEPEGLDGPSGSTEHKC